MIRARPMAGLVLVGLAVLALAGCAAAQERQILADWAAVIPHPAFGYAYSWGSQNGDMALDQSPALQDAFAGKNARSYRSGPDADPSFTDRGRCCGPRAGSSR